MDHLTFSAQIAILCTLQDTCCSDARRFKPPTPPISFVHKPLKTTKELSRITSTNPSCPGRRALIFFPLLFAIPCCLSLLQGIPCSFECVFPSSSVIQGFTCGEDVCFPLFSLLLYLGREPVYFLNRQIRTPHPPPNLLNPSSVHFLRKGGFTKFRGFWALEIAKNDQM